MLWSRALVLALASSRLVDAADHAGSGSTFADELSSSSDANHVLPSCNDTAAATLYWNKNTNKCLDATNFSLATVQTPLSSASASRICGSLSCRRIFQSAEAIERPSDCLVNKHIRLQADVLNQLAWYCTNGSASGSAYNSDEPTVGDGASACAPFCGQTYGSASHSDPMTVATVVCITIGALLAFIVVVVAVVWYKRKSLKDLRHHAYTDPLVEVKPRLGSGIFNGSLARRMRDRFSSGSRKLTATTTSSSSHINVVPLRPIQPTFHGDTLWSDEELLSRHMRAEDIEDIRVIGNGAHGVVYLVRHRGSRLLASKRLVQDHITREKTRLLIAEIKLVAKLEHPCIVQFVGAAWTTESDLQALFEYMPNGDLCTHLAKTSQPDESETWDLMKVMIAMDIAEALVYVHSFTPPLVHRDLKSRNVLLDENMRAKLTDFGVSRFHSTNNTMTTGIGTSRWLAPEVMAGGGTYDQSCDIYSLGILISELDTHRLPFAGLRMPSGNPMPEMSILQLVSQGKLQPTFRPTCPESLRAIALRCVAFEAKDRPSAIEVSYALRTIAKKEFGM